MKETKRLKATSKYKTTVKQAVSDRDSTYAVRDRLLNGAISIFEMASYFVEKPFPVSAARCERLLCCAGQRKVAGLVEMFLAVV